MEHVYRGFMVVCVLMLGACSGGGQGTTATAQQRMDMAVHADPFVQSMMTASIEAEQLGNMTDMLVFARKSYDKDTDNPDVVWRYARALRMNDEVAKALEVLKPFTVRDGMPAMIYTEYAAGLLSDGRLEEAQAYAARATKMAPDSPRVWNIAGVAADATGDHDTAQTHLNKALGLVPDGDERTRAVVLNNLALSLAAQGKTEEAEKMSERAMTGAQYYPQIRTNRTALNRWADIARNSTDVPDVTIVEPAAGEAPAAPTVPAVQDAPLVKGAKMSPVVDDVPLPQLPEEGAAYPGPSRPRPIIE